METERRNQVVLGVMLVILAIVGYRALTQTSAAPGPTSNARGHAAGSSARAAAATTVEAPDVHLDALERERPKPEGQERNLFRFKPKAPPPPPPGATRPSTTAPTVTAPPVPTGPPPPPPITLKFIGVIDRGGGQPKIAVLSDGIGPPIHGVEGGTVAGKYRILRIGAESIEMAYLDGRGRQTIRLSGS
ncbi:MAG TPA: hypothetical protein VFA27_08615 [Vicinamibacterales bacterium]|nr:hypothetical protein [Vicinamibacterales bacterium]